MSLYNTLFGENEEAIVLLGMIGVTRNEFQRYRDVWLNKEGTIITVLTRLGGGNRPEYKQVFINMKKNKNFIKEYDDDFDNTYCYFEFKVPDEYLFTAGKMKPEKEHPHIHQMFMKEIEEAKDPNSEASKRAEKLASMIFEGMENSGENGIRFISL